MLKALSLAVLVIGNGYVCADEPATRPVAPALPDSVTTAPRPLATPLNAAARQAAQPLRQTNVYRLKNVAVQTAAEAIDRVIRTKHKLKPMTDGLVVKSRVIIIPEPTTNVLIISAESKFAAEIAQLVEEIDTEPTIIQVQATISLTGSDGKKQIVSRPMIRTINGRTASITVGSEKYNLELILTPTIVPYSQTLPKK